MMKNLNIAMLLVLIIMAMYFVLRSRKKTSFRENWRKLWYDHVGWTRLYIVSRISKLPDKDAALERLLQNQEDLGDAIGKLKGPIAAKQASKLLVEHIEIAGRVVEAAIKNDKDTLSKENEKWHQNADEISRFIADATSLHEDEVRKHMYSHLELTTREVTLRLGAQWQKDVVNFDAVVTQALGMADYFAEGLLKKK